VAEFTLIESLAAEIVIPADGILSRTVYAGEGVKAVVFGFDAGQELSEHAAAVPAIIHILDGEAVVTLAGRPHEVGPGAWVHLAAGTRHSVLARTPVVMLLLLLARAD
jgi:quercetin dioxygenase-like cupin family protein